MITSEIYTFKQTNKQTNAALPTMHSVPIFSLHWSQKLSDVRNTYYKNFSTNNNFFFVWFLGVREPHFVSHETTEPFRCSSWQSATFFCFCHKRNITDRNASHRRTNQSPHGPLPITHCI